MIIVLRGGVVGRSVKPGHMSLQQSATLSENKITLKIINTLRLLYRKVYKYTEYKGKTFFFYTADLKQVYSHIPLILKCSHLQGTV